MIPANKPLRDWKQKLFDVYVQYYNLTCTCDEGIENEFYQASSHYQRCAYWRFCHAVNRSEHNTITDVLAKVKELKEMIINNCLEKRVDRSKELCEGCEDNIRFVDSVFGSEVGKGRGEEASPPKKRQGMGTHDKDKVSSELSQTAASPPKDCKCFCKDEEPKCDYCKYHRAAAKKEKLSETDTIGNAAIEGKSLSSPSQNSQKCKGCNQDFEGVHRSYCPTLKDRTRKVRR